MAYLLLKGLSMNFMRERGRTVLNLLRTCGVLGCIGSLTLAAADPKTHVAADCDLASVQAAVDAADNGDIVVIPPGTASWTGGLTVRGKGITLIGSGAEKTIINELWKDGLSSQSLISVQGSGTNFVRISGFTIVELAGRVTSMISIGSISTSNYFRVDNMVFTNLNKAAIQPTGWSIGVVDHCSFFARPLSGATGVRVYGEGNYSWDTRPPSWGDINKVYIEDCNFSWQYNANGAVDSYNGARWAFRHNLVTNVNVGNHGTDSTGAFRSTHSFEVYNNEFKNSTKTKMLFFAFRGGTGPIFNNTVSGYAYPFISVMNYRTTGTNIYKGTTPCCLPWGAVTGSNPLDGNIDETGWPAYDSIGRTSPTHYFKERLAPNGISQGYTVQGSQPLYAWGNTLNGGERIFVRVGNSYINVGDYADIPSASDVIKEGRDYFVEVPMPNYTPFEYPHPFTRRPDPELPLDAGMLPPQNVRVSPKES